ncbi:MAG TPA: CAP domain-containing protein [Nitrolancea sp.]
MPRRTATWRGVCAFLGRLLTGLTLVALLPLASLTSVAPAAAATDDTAQAFTLINTYRAWLGLPPMTRNPKLDASAQAHARYYQLNINDPSLNGMGLHVEQPGNPGFTGADMQARVDAQGYDGWANENIGLSGSMVASVEWFIGTIGHRLTLIDPRYTDIGLGMVNDGNAKIEVIDVGAPNWSDTAQPDFIAWPPDGMAGVPLDFWGEAPNPFAGASYPTGYPITLKYFGPGSVSYDSTTLTTNGQTVPSFAQTGSGWLTRQTDMIAATDPLQPGTKYTVNVSGTANGAPFTRSWSFQTASTPGEDMSFIAKASSTPLPPGVAAADPSVQSVWAAADGAVKSLAESRTWLWGPDVDAALMEDYAESPGGKRQVYYFDKSRMEITDPNGDRSSEWFVSNGLLVRDMIQGAIQTGETTFKPAQPATIPLAGDDKDNGNAPTYASLKNLASLGNGYVVPNWTGQPVDTVLHKDGSVSHDASLGSTTAYGSYDATTGQNVAGVFWDWMTAQPWQWIYVLGHPLSEPYWVQTNVKGQQQWVLVQAFERRVLTYTPSNVANWQIEMGNVGRAYYEWRYGSAPPGTP